MNLVHLVLGAIILLAAVTLIASFGARAVKTVMDAWKNGEGFTPPAGQDLKSADSGQNSDSPDDDNDDDDNQSQPRPPTPRIWS